MQASIEASGLGVGVAFRSSAKCKLGLGGSFGINIFQDLGCKVPE